MVFVAMCTHEVYTSSMSRKQPAGEVGIRALRAELPDVLQQVESTGQQVVVTKRGKAMAVIQPAVEPAAREPHIIALTSLKGGVGKTTISMHLAATLGAMGKRVMVLDADNELSAHRWQQHATREGIELPFEVMAANHNTLMRQARQLESSGYTVIIDTPPNHREILKSAAAVADVIIVPVAATGLDLDRLASTLEMLSELEAAKPNLSYAVVLNRFDKRKGMSRDANTALEAYPRLQTVIHHLSVYEKAFGSVPDDLSPFQKIWAEILQALGAV